MVRPDNVRATIDSLHANVAILDSHGEITEVNEGWRRFGGQRNGASDCVGLNYVAVCRKAADTGDGSAKRVADGLQRLLSGRAVSYGIVYRCGECTFRMTARRVSHPDGGVIVAHQEITALLAARQARNMARRERDTSRRELHKARRDYTARVENAHEELGQRLAAISLAARALEIGGNVDDAVTLMKLAVEEARQDLKLLRHETRQAQSGGPH